MAIGLMLCIRDNQFYRFHEVTFSDAAEPGVERLGDFVPPAGASLKIRRRDLAHGTRQAGKPA